MSRSTKLAAHRLEFARTGKLKLSLADRARQHLYVVVRAIESKGVDNVSAGNAKMNRNSGGNQNAVWNKQILLSDHAHRHRAIGTLLSAKIVLDELSRQVQRQWINIARAFQKMQQRSIDLVVARGWYEAQNQHGEQEGSQLSPIHRSLDPGKLYSPPNDARNQHEGYNVYSASRQFAGSVIRTGMRS